MRLHASTNERSTILPDFWKRIWEVTGAPGSIIDHGCGFMPLSFPWMSLPEGTTYRGVDIDTAQSRFLNAVLQTSGAPPQVQVEDGDVLTDIYPSVDVVCMLKLLPLLERQVGIDGVRETVARQECHRLVVSYPVASIGGREKGMPDFYRASFAALMRQLGRKYVEIPFPDELVFVAGK
jgi:hypothetical protein